MNVTEPMRQQLAMLEDALEGAIENNLPPLASKFIFNSPMYHEYLEKAENVLIAFMDEKTGEVDGVQAQEAMRTMFPGLGQWISIPRKKFFIADMVNSMSTELIGRRIMG